MHGIYRKYNTLTPLCQWDLNIFLLSFFNRCGESLYCDLITNRKVEAKSLLPNYRRGDCWMKPLLRHRVVSDTRRLRLTNRDSIIDWIVKLCSIIYPKVKTNSLIFNRVKIRYPLLLFRPYLIIKHLA